MPTQKVIGQTGALIKRFGYLYLEDLLPQVIRYWRKMQNECKTNYNWNMGYTPCIDNFLSHPKEILAITENIAVKQAKSQEYVAMWKEEQEKRDQERSTEEITLEELLQWKANKNKEDDVMSLEELIEWNANKIKEKGEV